MIRSPRPTAIAATTIAITAADGPFNLGHCEDGPPEIFVALHHSIPAAQVRAGCVLDTQPPSASRHFRPALAALGDAASKLNVKKMPGIPYGLSEPFNRAIKAISGEETYYRWGPASSAQTGE